MQGRYNEFGGEGARHSLGLRVPGFVLAEHMMAVDLYIDMMVRSHMTSRTSGGAVPEISDLLYEDFTLRERTKDRSLLSPIRVSAHHQTLVLQKGEIHPAIHLQSASEKDVITDDQLKHAGLWERGRPHAMDALRHLVLWLRKQEKVHGLAL